MNTRLFEQLKQEGLLSEVSIERIQQQQRSRLFSVHWELKTILYLGILLLTSGLGILVYKNIDTIGHQVILACIAVLCIGSFVYCERKKLPFSLAKVAAPNSFFDYIVLLGCLTFIIFITYLQVQYTAFGNAYGLATFIPMIVLFFISYYFDHLGVLSMAITNLAAWMGIAITPLNILNTSYFSDSKLIFAGLLLGILLNITAAVSERRNLKAHFGFTYMNFGMNILFISCLAGMLYFESILIFWLLPLAGITVYFYRKAHIISSFYLMLMLTIYAYIGISYFIVRLVANYSDGDAIITLGLLYFIFSAAGTVIFLVNMNKKLKHNDSI